MAIKTLAMLQFTIRFTIPLRIHLFSVQCPPGKWTSCFHSPWSLSTCSRVWAVFPVVEKGWKKARPKYGRKRLILPLGVQEELGCQSWGGSHWLQSPVPFFPSSAWLYGLQPPSLSNFENLPFLRCGIGHTKGYLVELTSSKIKSPEKC